MFNLSYHFYFRVKLLRISKEITPRLIAEPDNVAYAIVNHFFFANIKMFNFILSRLRDVFFISVISAKFNY